MACTTRDSNPDRSKSFFLCKIQERPWGPPMLLFSRYRGSFLVLEGPGRDVANHLHLASMLRTSEAIPIFVLLGAVQFS